MKRILFSFAAVALLCAPAAAQVVTECVKFTDGFGRVTGDNGLCKDQPKSEAPKQVRIPAESARGIGEAGQAAAQQQRELERLQLIQRVRFLEALLAALGVNLERLEVTAAPDGSLEVKEKPAPPAPASQRMKAPEKE